MRAQEIPDGFLEKASVTASSQRPRRSYGVLVGDSRRSHNAHIVCTVLSRRSHCAFTAFALRFHGVCTALTA